MLHLHNLLLRQRHDGSAGLLHLLTELRAQQLEVGLDATHKNT